MLCMCWEARADAPAQPILRAPHLGPSQPIAQPLLCTPAILQGRAPVLLLCLNSWQVRELQGSFRHVRRAPQRGQPRRALLRVLQPLPVQTRFHIQQALAPCLVVLLSRLCRLPACAPHDTLGWAGLGSQSYYQLGLHNTLIPLEESDGAVEFSRTENQWAQERLKNMATVPSSRYPDHAMLSGLMLIHAAPI